jgi:hypothetical protein
MAMKLEITALVSEIESSAKKAFSQCGALLMNGIPVNSKNTLIEAGVTEGSSITAALGAGVRYKEKRDQLIQNMERGGTSDKHRFVSLEVPIVSLTVHFSPDCYGLSGFIVNLADGTDSGLLGKVGTNDNRTTKTIELINPSGFSTRHPDSWWHGIRFLSEDHGEMDQAADAYDSGEWRDYKLEEGEKIVGIYIWSMTNKNAFVDKFGFIIGEQEWKS